MAENIKTRDEIRVEDTWAIEDLYSSDELWEKDCEALEKELLWFENYKNKLTTEASVLVKVLKKIDEVNQKLEKIYVYANEKMHENTQNDIYQKMAGQAQRLMIQINDTLAFVEPEILTLSLEKLEEYLSQNEELAFYKRYLLELFRSKEHILTKEIEEVLAKTYEITQAPSNIFSMFNNADVKFGTITNENGEKVTLTHGTYVPFLESKKRKVRREAFYAMYAQYDKMKNTLAAMMNANVQQAVFYAKVRKYSSSLEAALEPGSIPLSVYSNLIETVHQKLPAMYRYVQLRGKMLELEELHMYDLYVPVVERIEKKYTFEEAKKMVKNALSVLGSDYITHLSEGMENRWIDIYENQGKRSGAYSWGAYGTHPYVLLNYNASLNNVFTLAHEMGHALHTYYSNQTQEYIYSQYRIFVAEVASTCNEALLIHYLLENAKDESERKYLINYFLEQFRATVFRQTMFAEFEMKIHAMSEEGKTLTADELCQVYYQLNKEYFGDEILVDPEIAMEWARIPHFYTPFYVYQYATGFSAAIAISKKILDKEEGILEKYRKFLSGGSSMDCIELLKICGVDMTKREPVETALEVFEEYLKQLEENYENSEK